MSPERLPPFSAFIHPFMRIERRWWLTALVVAACGVSTQPVGVRRDTILGGVADTTTREVVGLVVSTPNGTGTCSGSLIAPNLVLTARHCIAETQGMTCANSSFGTPYPAPDIMVTTDGNAIANLTSWPVADGVRWFSVAQVIPYTVTSLCGGDLALLRLSSAISTACPLVPRVDLPVVDGEIVDAIGFGRTGPTGTSGRRFALRGGFRVCIGSCGSAIGPGEWVALSTQGGGICSGDSGGPALDQVGRVIGVAARGSPNCLSADYESVSESAVVSWLRNHASQAAVLGGYPPQGWVTGGSSSGSLCHYDGGVPVGGGSAGGVAGGGSAGGGPTLCPATTICRQGVVGAYCQDPGGGFPPGANTCSAMMGCASGFDCFPETSGAMTGRCLRICGGPAPRGSCGDASHRCVALTTSQLSGCVDPASPTLLPPSAAVCSGVGSCQSGFECLNTNRCIELCTSNGSPVGGGSAGGTPVSGGTAGGNAGGSAAGGSAAGGSAAGGSAAGGSAAGGSAAGGSSAGGGAGAGFAVTCGPSNCMGCCASGICVSFPSNERCGVSGTECKVCANTQTCNAGMCVAKPATSSCLGCSTAELSPLLLLAVGLLRRRRR
jgi:hypothetical protein